jgi:hypothetical protein
MPRRRWSPFSQAWEKTLLPTVIGGREPRLQRLETDARSPLPLREMWLLAHADQTDLGRIVAVVSWLETW